MFFKIVPIDRQTSDGRVSRGPLYLKWKYGTGYDWRWSLKDFGNDVPVGIVATSQSLPVRGEFLRDYGIDTRWIDKAESPREHIHRLLGVAFAMQAGIDRPDIWLGRQVCFGFDTLPPFDMRAFYAEQAARREIPLLVVREKFKRKYPVTWRSKFRRVALLPLSIILGALPVNDTFTVGSDQRISTYNASWVESNSSEWTILAASDDVYDSLNGTDGWAICHWSGDTFDDNQYAQVTITALAAAKYIGPATRKAAGTTWTSYVYLGAPGDSYLEKFVGGTETVLGSAGAGFVVSSVYRLESNGTTQTPKKDGAAADIGAQTDSSISSGYGGMSSYAASSGTRADDFEGGNLGGVVAGRGFQKASVMGV